jgi:hypothetical protein
VFTNPTNIKVKNLNKPLSQLFSISFLTLNLLLPIIWFSALSAMKYTGDYTVGERLNAKENIIWEYSTLDYTRQVDGLIASLHAGNNSEKLIQVNSEILKTLKILPAKPLAIEYLKNCEKLISCDKQGLKFVKTYFPFAVLEFNENKKLLKRNNEP